jgi:hypothetical protein
MKKTCVFYLLITLFTACSSNKLDREKALQLLREQKLYPKTATYNIFISDPIYAKRMLDAGLEEKGLVKIQRTQRLSEAGQSIISFTEKAKPYLEPQTDEDKHDNIQRVKIAVETVAEVTGIQTLDEKHAVVEYNTTYKNITPFSGLSKLKLDEKTAHKTNFSLYDDGWRVAGRY